MMNIFLKCFAIGLLLQVVNTVNADIIMPDEALCRGMSLGQSCLLDEQPGTCETAKCCSLDYSHGIPPSTRCNQCLKCQQTKVVPEILPEEILDMGPDQASTSHEE